MATKKKGLLAAAGAAAASGGGGGSTTSDPHVNTEAFNYAYVAMYDDHMPVKFSISSSGVYTSPTQMTDTSNGFRPSAMAMDYVNELLYVYNTGNSKITVHDVSDPASSPATPSVAYYDTAKTYGGLELVIDDVNGLLFAGSNTNSYGVAILDASSPTSLSFSGAYSSNYIYDMALDTANEIVYAISATTLTIYKIDYSTPSSPSLISSLYIHPDVTNPGNAQYDATNEVLYVVSNGTTKFVAYDVSGTGISKLGDFTLGSGGYSVSLDVANEVAYVSDASALRAIDISNPSSMSSLSTLSTAKSGFSSQIDFVNEILYLSNYTQNKVTSVDISNPSSLTLLNSYASASYTDNCRYIKLGYQETPCLYIE